MRLRFNPSDHIFKTAVAAAGLITLGLFGLLFGLIGGALIDQLLLTHRRNIGIKRFLRSGNQEAARFFSIGTNDRLASSAMAISWYICRKEPARAAIVSSVFPEKFPDAVRNIMDLLREEDKTDFRSMAVFFGSHASEKDVENLNELISACGLENAAIRALAEDIDAAEILSEAGFRMSRNREDVVAVATDADYTILGVDPGTAGEEIKRVYHKLAADFHPDGGRELSPEQQKITEDAFKRIQAAYDRLRKA